MNSVDRAEGLLEQIADTALDDDYYAVQAGRPEPSRRFNTVLTAVGLGVFALMVTVAAVQTRTDRPATEREQRALAQDVERRRDVGTDRRATVARLRAQVADLGAAAAGVDPALLQMRALTAAVGVQGPGVRIEIEPADGEGERGEVSDGDLQVLVNALWFAGAEAVSINDQRIGTLTSIRQAGSAITVNYVSVDAPFTIEAIGDAETLRTRFEDSRLGRDWDSREKKTDLTFGITSTTDLRLDAVDPARQRLRHATVTEADS